MSPRTVVIAAALLFLSAASGAVPAQVSGPRVIEITAERFEFWPPEIPLAVGEEVEFRIRSADTAHGFRLLGTPSNVTIPKRGKGYASVRFTASKQGRYTFECSRMCGAGHTFMRGLVIVRTRTPQP